MLRDVQFRLPFEPRRTRAGRQPHAPTPEIDTTGDRPVSPPPEVYFVRHRRARRYLLRVEVSGRVRVTIPRGGSRREAEAFAKRQAGWIAQQRSKLPEPRWNPTERAEMQVRAEAELPVLLRAMADRLDLRVSRVTIRDQRSRWGSCGRDGHITLNWRLVAMPDGVRDYVLIHELMHLKRLDHSPEYWAMVEEVCPTAADARDWLRAHGSGLLR